MDVRLINCADVHFHTPHDILILVEGEGPLRSTSHVDRSMMA